MIALDRSNRSGVEHSVQLPFAFMSESQYFLFPAETPVLRERIKRADQLEHISSTRLNASSTRGPELVHAVALHSRHSTVARRVDWQERPSIERKSGVRQLHVLQDPCGHPRAAVHATESITNESGQLAGGWREAIQQVGREFRSSTVCISPSLMSRYEKFISAARPPCSDTDRTPHCADSGGTSPSAQCGHTALHIHTNFETCFFERDAWPNL